ncbi:MAG: response regulator transcription factor [Bacillota bacterium]
MKLLIADDEPSIRKGLSEMDWQSIGLTICHVASNGEEALEAIKNLRPDIILTDICMIGLSGIDLAKYVYEHNMDCQIIFLSGYDDFKYAKSAITYNVFDYILKPSDPEEIFQSVKRAIEELKAKRTASDSVSNLKKHLSALKFVDTMSENQPEKAMSKADKTMHEIISYIENNYMKDISLVTLSKEIHFNPIYISRLIKKKSGYTFLEILTAVRMYHAARLLTSTDEKISSIAEKVGIGDQRYFSQIFKKTFNMTPFEYRKSQKSSEHIEILPFLGVKISYDKCFKKTK